MLSRLRLRDDDALLSRLRLRDFVARLRELRDERDFTRRLGRLVVARLLRLRDRDFVARLCVLRVDRDFARRFERLVVARLRGRVERLLVARLLRDRDRWLWTPSSDRVRLRGVARLDRDERLPCVARPDRDERPSVARLLERGAVDRSYVRLRVLRSYVRLCVPCSVFSSYWLRVVRESERVSRVALRPTWPLPVVRAWLSVRDERERASVSFPPLRVRVVLRPVRPDSVRPDSVRPDSVRVLRALRLDASREVLPLDERVAVRVRPTRPDDVERDRVVVRADDS